MKPITALVILDGFGCRKDAQANAIKIDGAKHIRELWETYPHTQLQASGLAVGLPEGQMGNSEVGHLNIGAGRIVYQELTRITKSIHDGDFFENEAFLSAMENCKAHGSALHLMGLCSDGGVHSHLEHLYALVRMARDHGLKRVYIHCFMDGRDVPPTSGLGYIQACEKELAALGCGQIATVCGRYYAMDRDNRYERVQEAYAALVYGRGRTASSAQEAMEQAYKADETDEFIRPTVVLRGGAPTACIGADDSIVFFNFRPDRARELTHAFLDADFPHFAREKGMFRVHYVSMTQYDAVFNGRLSVAFKPAVLTNTLGEYLSGKGLTQLRIAETEKYAHVTFFFNGGVEAPNPQEERCLIPSPKVATYDLLPRMSANEVADEAVARIRSGKYDVMILNFANADMVGHTGVLDAAVEAIHTVDACTGRVVEAVLETGGRCIVTADHGNAEQMIDPLTGGAFTAHTTNPVPCILVDERLKDARLRADGRLCDIAPTLLELMGLEKPEEMTGNSLIAHN